MIWRRLCADIWANENCGLSFNLSILIEFNQLPATGFVWAACCLNYHLPASIYWVIFLGSEGAICCKSQRLFWCAIPRLCQQKISRGGFLLQHFCCEGIMIDDLAGLHCTFYDFNFCHCWFMGKRTKKKKNIKHQLLFAEYASFLSVWIVIHPIA